MKGNFEPEANELTGAKDHWKEDSGMGRWWGLYYVSTSTKGVWGGGWGKCT